MDALVVGASSVVTCDGAGSPAERLGIVPDGAVAIREGRIAWIGPRELLPAALRGLPELFAAGGLVTPGYVDAHTHLVFAGDRAAEFGQRCAGVPYAELLAKGGGILATMRATRAASEAELVRLARPRLARLLAEGVTTAEVKSGYAGEVEGELRMLRAVRRLAAEGPVQLVPTLLPLHALPPEAAADRAGWVRRMTQELVARAAAEQLCRFVDVFVEQGAFTPDEARALAASARRHGLGVRLHVDQLTDGRGAALAAELRVATADHLEETPLAELAQLAAAGVAVTLLPISTLFLKCPRWAPGRALADAGVALALGTNVNPGSAMTESFSLALGLACLGNGLSAAEAFLAGTVGSATALGLTDRGRLRVGARADLVIHAAGSIDHLAYHLGVSHVRTVLIGGVRVFDAPGRDEPCC